MALDRIQDVAYLELCSLCFLVYYETNSRYTKHIMKWINTINAISVVNFLEIKY